MSKKKSIKKQQFEAVLDSIKITEDQAVSFLDKHKQDQEFQSTLSVADLATRYNNRYNSFRRKDLLLLFNFVALIRLQGHKTSTHNALELFVENILLRKDEKEYSVLWSLVGPYLEKVKEFDKYLDDELNKSKKQKTLSSSQTYGFEKHPFSKWQLTPKGVQCIKAIISEYYFQQLVGNKIMQELFTAEAGKLNPLDDIQRTLLQYLDYDPEILFDAKRAKATQAKNQSANIYLTNSLLQLLEKNNKAIEDFFADVESNFPEIRKSKMKIIQLICDVIDEARHLVMPQDFPNPFEWIKIKNSKNNESAVLRILYVCFLSATDKLMSYEQYTASKKRQTDFEKYVDREIRRLLALPVK